MLTLTERRELDECGAAGRLGDLHLVQFAGEAALALSVAPEESGAVEGRHGDGQIGHGVPIDIERCAGSVRNHGEVLPGSRRKRSHGSGALGAGGVGDLQEGDAVVEPNPERAAPVRAAVDHGPGCQGRGLDPGHPGVGGGLQYGTVRIGRNADLLFPIELDPAPDHRPLHGNSGRLGAIPLTRGVPGRRSVLVEMIDRRGVAVVGRLWKIGLLTLGGLFLLVPGGVEIDVAGGSGLDVGNLHPDESLVHHRVEFLDLRGEERLVIAVDKAQVASILLRRGEVKIPVMKPHHHRGGAGGIGKRHAVIGSVDGELGAGAPGFVPPGAGMEGGGQEQA